MGDGGLTGSEMIGLIMWVMILFPSMAGYGRKRKVSGNRTGPQWEQDTPWSLDLEDE